MKTAARLDEAGPGGLLRNNSLHNWKELIFETFSDFLP